MYKMFIALIIIFAQQQTAFDVASIKVINDLKAPTAMTTNPGGVTFTNVTAMECIAAAYSVKDYQITGPDWLKSERYTIAARTASPATDDQIKQMLQTLLADRFKLVLHREAKDLAVYAITEAKGGTKLRPTQGGPENRLSFQANNLTFRNYSIAGLAKFLSSLPGVDRPISDATELKGNYDFEISVDAESNDPGALKRAMLDWETLFAAMDRQLGLKVEARKAPGDLLVVDRVEKPTLN